MASPAPSPLCRFGRDHGAFCVIQWNGCPWDRAQNFSTIAPYTLEEAYEVVDAIACDDVQSLPDELGDLLLQVVFHARMAEEQNLFAIENVIGAICEKMERPSIHTFLVDGIC